jgi:hypothetical protein
MADEPKRFKTVLSFKCVQGHINLYDHRIRAGSLEEAQKLTFEHVRQKARCRYCNSTVTGIQMIGTEQVTLHPVYWTFGYVCQCGERVAVLREEEGRGMDIPDKATVACSQGHSRTILNTEFLLLERWEEQTN